MKINNINIVVPISSINSMKLKRDNNKHKDKDKSKKFEEILKKQLDQQKKK